MNATATDLSVYLQKECDYLRTRLSINIDETAALERHAIAATGVLWAWIGTHSLVATPLLAWLPLLLTAFLGFRAASVYVRIVGIRAYLAKLEAEANLPPGLGWTAALEDAGAHYRVLTANVFWAGITLVNLVLALVAPRLLRVS